MGRHAPTASRRDLTRRRWRNFGTSGAKLIWGGEAVAVRHDGRANPNQLLMTPANQPAIAALRDELVAAHRERFGANADADLFVGLQLTHSGRYARPERLRSAGAAGRLSPPGARSPLPSRRPRAVEDAELDRLVDDFVAARASRRAMRLPVRRRQGVPWLSRSRAAGRPGARGALRRHRSRTGCASCAASSRRSARRCPAC